jgi:hypothetical protein
MGLSSFPASPGTNLAMNFPSIFRLFFVGRNEAPAVALAHFGRFHYINASFAG